MEKRQQGCGFDRNSIRCIFWQRNQKRHSRLETTQQSIIRRHGSSKARAGKKIQEKNVQELEWFFHVHLSG